MSTAVVLAAQTLRPRVSLPANFCPSIVHSAVNHFCDPANQSIALRNNVRMRGVWVLDLHSVLLLLTGVFINAGEVI